MSRYDWDDDEPYVVIEHRPPGIGSFLAGLAAGAAVALLFAPRTGEETRRDLQRRAREIGDQAQSFVGDMTESVNDTIGQARQTVRDRIDHARDAMELRKRQVTNAVEAGRAAARDARVDLEQRIADTKAAYRET